MKVTFLKLMDYRNYEVLELRPHERLTVLLGENAQGKTNAAEAIYLCASGRSHRTPRDGELIRWETAGAYVRCDVQREGVERRIEMRIPKGGKKQVRLDGTPIARMGELMGCLNAVMFSPEELRLVKDGPGERRRFLDILLSQIRPAYFYALSSYQKALAQRNALLKEIALKQASQAELSAWDEQLCRYSETIHKARAACMQSVARFAAEMHRKVSGGKEELRVSYEPDLSGAELMEWLEGCREDDIRRGSTARGPHRDDLMLSIGGADVRTFGSQGQQRTAALSLKLAELAAMEETTGEKPVLILDDVMSELDGVRQKLLLESISNCQTFLTCTQLPEGCPEGKVVRVEGGRLL